MLRHTKYTPYIRRRRPSDKCASIFAALRMVGNDHRFVMVQRGVPDRVMVSGHTRAEIISKTVGAMTCALKRGANWKKPRPRDFRAWARGVGAGARGSSARDRA